MRKLHKSSLNSFGVFRKQKKTFFILFTSKFFKRIFFMHVGNVIMSALSMYFKTTLSKKLSI